MEDLEDQSDKHVNPSSKLVEDFNLNFTTTRNTSTISKKQKRKLEALKKVDGAAKPNPFDKGYANHVHLEGAYNEPGMENGTFYSSIQFEV